VDDAVRTWARQQAARHLGVIAIGYFGSYARGTWGVGSDIDLVAVVDASTEPFETRAASWDTSDLPVPADLLVYTREEFGELAERRDRFGRMLTSEIVWTHGLPPDRHSP
jgi:predicted nucleotidyltransferase